MYYCNIRLPYRIKKVVGNISINILGHEEKCYEMEMGL